jgi:acyl-coenzyme A thioesterase PaaI-like protein
LKLRAHVVESTDDRAVVDATIEANGKVTATCRGTFVAVQEGHPAYHRW